MKTGTALALCLEAVQAASLPDPGELYKTPAGAFLCARWSLSVGFIEVAEDASLPEVYFISAKGQACVRVSVLDSEGAELAWYHCAAPGLVQFLRMALAWDWEG